MVYSNLLNSAVVQIQGVDFEANYTFNWFGNWAARLLGTYQPVNETQAFPGAPFTFTQVGPGSDLIAKTHLTGFLSYSVDDWTFGVQDHWISSLSKYTSSSPSIPQVYANPNLSAANYVGIDVQRDFTAGGIDWSAYFNVRNIFNNKGVLDTNSAVQGITYPVAADNDIMGRYFTLGMRLKL
jgi:hypothetical protein